MSQTQTTAKFEGKAKRKPIALMDALRYVEQQHKVPVGRQVRDIFALSRNHIGLSPQEYFYYRLFLQDMPMEQKKQFVGNEMQRAIFLACNRMAAWQTAADKLNFYVRMQAEGFRVPQNYALIQRQQSSYTCAYFGYKDRFREWFFSDMPTPAFCKPVGEESGKGAFLISAVDKATGEFTDGKGNAFAFDALWEVVERYLKTGGVVVQEALRAHADIAVHSGGHLATMRMVVCLEDSGPKLVDAAWRVPAEDNTVDNFSFAGNLFAGVDVKTGAVLQVKRSDMIPQPVTDSPLQGVTLPLWGEAVENVLQASQIFPDLRLQSWDLAVTDQGVAFVEMNPGGNVDNAQVTMGAPLWQGAFVEFVQKAYRDEVNDMLRYPRKKVEKMLFGKAGMRAA